MEIVKQININESVYEYGSVWFIMESDCSRQEPLPVPVPSQRGAGTMLSAVLWRAVGDRPAPGFHIFSALICLRCSLASTLSFSPAVFSLRDYFFFIHDVLLAVGASDWLLVVDKVMTLQLRVSVLWVLFWNPYQIYVFDFLFGVDGCELVAWSGENRPAEYSFTYCPTH